MEADKLEAEREASYRVHDREQLEESHRRCEVAFGEMMVIYQKQREEAPTERGS
jgi:hypothetical protein